VAAGRGVACALPPTARAAEQVPGAVLHRVADPDVEVGVDPRSRMQLREVAARGVRVEEGADRGGDAAGAAARERLEERAQERLARVAVVLPRVLPVEDDGDERLGDPGRARLLARVARAGEQIVDG